LDGKTHVSIRAPDPAWRGYFPICCGIESACNRRPQVRLLRQKGCWRSKTNWYRRSRTNGGAKPGQGESRIIPVIDSKDNSDDHLNHADPDNSIPISRDKRQSHPRIAPATKPVRTNRKNILIGTLYALLLMPVLLQKPLNESRIDLPCPKVLIRQDLPMQRNRRKHALDNEHFQRPRHARNRLAAVLATHN
jgi:hypothetical protein